MNKLSLNTKIYFILSIFIVACVAVSYIGLVKMNDIKTSMNLIVQGSAARVGNAHELKALFFTQLINEKNMILEDTKEETEVHVKRLNIRHGEVLDKKEESMKISTKEGLKNLEIFHGFYNEWWTLNKHLQELVNQNNREKAATLSTTKGREIRLKVEKVIIEIVERNESFMASDVTKADNDYKEARTFLFITSFVAIFSGLLLAFLVLRALTRRIDEVISSLEENSSQVTLAAQQIASSSEELSHAATEQASSLEETAASIEELNSMVHKNSENARRTSDLATSAHSTAEKGKSAVQDMIRSIDEISQSNTMIMMQVEDSNQKMNDISKVIAEIGNKTKVINDIVFQTKLLSFNASVEAARAGVHGNGFAIVAQEVGTLAEMSGKAAKEITSMLESSIEVVESIAKETQQKVSVLILDGKEKVKSGSAIAKGCGDILNEIVKDISSVSQMAVEISGACQEQSIGVQEITKAMNVLDQVTQINAASSEEAASSAVELSSQAESLKNAIEVMVVTIKGDKGRKSEALEYQPQKTFKTPASTRHNVVEFKKKNKMPETQVALKQASGYNGSTVPSENDPRFKDI